MARKSSGRAEGKQRVGTGGVCVAVQGGGRGATCAWESVCSAAARGAPLAHSTRGDTRSSTPVHSCHFAAARAQSSEQRSRRDTSRKVLKVGCWAVVVIPHLRSSTYRIIFHRHHHSLRPITPQATTITSLRHPPYPNTHFTHHHPSLPITSTSSTKTIHNCHL